MTKSTRIIYWVSTIWLSLGMTSTGLVQLFKGKAGTGGLESVTQLGYPAYVLPLLGTFKILGVVAVLIPKFALLKEWAYAGFFFVVTGAIFSHVVNGDNGKELFGAVLLLILTLVSWYTRPAERKTIPA